MKALTTKREEATSTIASKRKGVNLTPPTNGLSFTDSKPIDNNKTIPDELKSNGLLSVDHTPSFQKTKTKQGTQWNQTEPMQLITSGVIQLMKPTGIGLYNIKGGTQLYYKGEPPDEDRYKFYRNSTAKMTQMKKEEDILSKVEDGQVEATSSAPLKPSGITISDASPEVRTFEAAPATSDELLSGILPLGQGDFHHDYQRKIKENNVYYKRIQKLINDAKMFLATLPQEYVGLWRFHDNWQEYESHAFQQAQKKLQMVPYGVLQDAIDNLEVLSSHMYESSKKNESPGVSFARSIDSLIDASFHMGADAVLKKIIFGGQDFNAARFLSFVAIPHTELRFPENVRIPEHAQRRDRKGEARARSLKETEVLHLPQPTSGGRTHSPLFTVTNPFESQPKAVRPPEASVPLPRFRGMILTQQGMIEDQLSLIRYVSSKGGNAKENLSLLKDMKLLHTEMVRLLPAATQQDLITKQEEMIAQQKALITDVERSGQNSTEHMELLKQMDSLHQEMVTTLHAILQTL